MRIGSSGFSQWYSNDFFTDHADAAVYRKYFPNQVLPANVTPLPAYVPGGNRDGQSALLFQLHAIRYSDQYGGSVQLRFRRQYTVEYDFRKGNFLFDARGLELVISVTPVPGDLPRGPGHRGVIHVEFAYDGVTAYRLQGQRVVHLSDDHRAELDERLDETARNVEQNDSFRQAASRFVHGWLHSQIQTELGVNDVVDSMILSDDFFDVRTHVGRPHWSIQSRVEDPVGHGFFANQSGDWFGKEEFRVRLQARYFDANNDWVTLPARNYDVPAGEDTPWYTGPMGILGASYMPTKVEIDIDFLEKDLLFSEEEWANHTIVLDGDVFQTSHAQGVYGVIAEQVLVPPSGYSFEDETHVPVDYTLRVRAFLGLQ